MVKQVKDQEPSQLSGVKPVTDSLANERGFGLYAIVGVILAVLVLLGGLFFFSSVIQWRVHLVALKLQGSLDDLSWSETFDMLRPGNKYIDAELFAVTKSLYQSIKNPHNSSVDVSAGATTFSAQCARCHGAHGSGGLGPELRRGDFRHGVSDWALFRTISRGIPGTGMPGLTLPETSTWQVVAFVNSLRQSPVQSTTTVALPNVTYERLLKADREPGNWLTYSGTYKSHRYSQLDQINRKNVQGMKLKWIVQMPTTERRVKATPLVIDEVMYVTEPPNNVLAVDSETGGQLWSYQRNLPEKIPLCCSPANSGLAVLGNTLYMGTLDAHLLALDATTGRRLWDIEVADYRHGYSITSAPLAVKDKIITGIAGGEFGIRGFIDAYDAKSGKRVWRFYTIPGPGEAGHETWTGDSWKTGGGPTWLTGSFDPELNLIYWGVGNPGPNYQGDVRSGINLYSNSVVALDADTGKLRWYFQFTPHDEHDWDAVQIPVLVDAEFRGKKRKLMLWANRNAFYYILDRETGEFLLAREFVKQTWAERIDPSGRPVVRPESAPSPKGALVWPGIVGATNWWSPSYNPKTGLFYVPTWESADVFFKGAVEFMPGQPFIGSTSHHASGITSRTSVRALIPQTGELKWEYKFPTKPRTAMGGILSTAGDLLLAGNDDQFYVLDPYTGKELWKFNVGGEIVAAPITYLSKGHQRVTIAAGRALFTFGLEKAGAPKTARSRNPGRYTSR